MIKILIEMVSRTDRELKSTITLLLQDNENLYCSDFLLYLLTFNNVEINKQGFLVHMTGA